MTEPEFWAELAKHKGEFEVSGDNFVHRYMIRSKADEPLCPLAVVLGLPDSDRTTIESALGEGQHNWAINVMEASDRRWPFVSLRRRLLDVLWPGGVAHEVHSDKNELLAC